ncbi:MAG: protein kinase [Acidobacteria bacterium]|nr:protein kinase [Acidobacteriota bacterium]
MNQELTANTTLSHYRIVAPLGAGGMGEVWLAEDTRLDRQVALKLLPAAFTQDAERVRRFIQEAKAASGLNHPNIITVFDIGECAAGRFIVMELVAGRTLRSVIAADNSLDTFLSLSQQMAKALSAAHSAGITHRDIKPDNIMVRDDGYVKVLDFGLARLNPTRSAERGTRKEEAETLVQQTTPGTVMGTVAYMSPEQARGETVSHPSDIFALGIVLYELATGRHPFQAETLVGYLHAITLQEPLPLTQWKPELPAALNDLIQRMLAKDARQRPTASEVAQALQDIERHGDTVKQRSGDDETMMLPAAAVSAPRADEGFWVAVLPFKWRGANAELEALAEGLSEDIVTGLSRFSYLRVIARGSTLKYTNDSGDVRAIGKELGARYVMEGSLRQAGALLRVAVQLVDASTGAHLWAETYDRQFRAEDIFALQDDLVPRIVSTVADQYGALVHSMSASLRGRSARQYSAHEAVLRAFGYFERVTAEEHAEVREILEAAVASAPSHSDCQAILSVIYWHEYANGYNVRPDSLSRAHAAARQAVAAAPTNHLAHFTLAAVLFLQKDFLAFRAAAERALALNRMDGSTTGFLGNLIAYSGDWEYGLGITERAMQLNPNHPGWFHFPAVTFAYHKRDYRGALESALKVNVPGYFWTHAALAAAYGQLGEREPARAALRELLGLVPNFGALAREEYGKWLDAELTEHLLDGLRKAGLEELQTTATARYSTGSGSDLVPLTVPDAEEPDRYRSPYRTEASASIVVLPFANISADEENFCGGLAEERSSSVSSRLRHTVGREPERNELRVAFKAANDGRGSLVCVAGEPGIGKTTLVEDFLTELAAEHHCTIARGRCSERLAGTEAYLPLLEALESLLRYSTASGSEPGSFATAMKQLAPTWYAQVVPLNSESEESARLLSEVKAASQERMKRELASFLQAVAEQQPLVIFFDDLHWADVSTIDLLSFLAGKFDAMRVLIVTTYRPSDMLLAKHPFLQIKPDLQARGYCRELQLAFLNEAEIAQYLSLEFPNHGFPTDFAKLIHAKTEGSPLFMADLVRYLRDRCVIAMETSGRDARAPRWMLAQTLPDIERELPESVRGMIERKIAQLSEEDRKLLTAASVQGYEFDSAVVAQVLNLEADEVEERLEKLERVFAFVKVTSEGEFPNRTLTLKYRFVHVLYQNALYGALRITRKASLSREVAQTLEGFYGEQRTSVANQLAALYEAGREYARAAEYYRLAAEHATRVFAYQEAVALARRGLGLLQSEPDTTARTRQELALQITLSVPLGACRGLASQESRELFTRARELAQQLGDPPELWTIMVGQWRSYLVGGDNNMALKLGEEFLAQVRTKAPAATIWGHQMMTSGCNYGGEFASACTHVKEMLAVWNPQPHYGEEVVYAGENPVMIGLFMGAASLWYLGYPAQALQQSQQALALARQDASPFGMALATFLAAELHISRREPQRVRELAEECLALSTEHGFPQWMANGHICRGWALAATEQVAAGVAQMSEGLTAMHAFEADLGRSRYLALLGEACAATGQLAEGLSLLAEALAFAEQSGERFFEAEIYRLRGELLLQSEAPQAEVEECFHQAIKVAQRQQAKSLELRAMMSLARLWQQPGKILEAQQMLAELYGWFTEGFDTADLQDAKALLEELRP